MQDNFDLKKYLRHGNKLLNENIGGYVDLRPIYSLNEAPMGDDMVTIDLDMAWDDDQAAQAAFDQFDIEVQETNGNPGTFEVTGRKEDILAYLKSEYYGMDDETIQQYYPELLDSEMSEGEPDGDQYDGEYDSEFGPAITNELEKPKSIYATDDSEDEKGFDVPGDDKDSADIDDRMMMIGGDRIEGAVADLIDDGFDPEDILDFCKMAIEKHTERKSYLKAQGRKF